MTLPPPPPFPKPKAPKRGIDPFARMLATTVREAHGVDQASTLDMSEDMGRPRGYVGTRNIALERALGVPGLPLGRIVEISGWAGAGKSTVLDQCFAEAQKEGGIAVLADTERGRDRNYMEQLGVQSESCVWIGGHTVEGMFDEVETLARRAADLSARAWVDALNRAGVKCPPAPTYKHEVFDPATRKDANRRPVVTYRFASWGREQAGALLAWQKEHRLNPSSIRDGESRAALRPCIVFAENPSDEKEALAAWLSREAHPLVQPADRPVIIGWDSVAGTPTEAEMEGDARDVQVASAAKVIRRNLRRMVQLIDNEAICFVLVNQRYEVINTGFVSRGPPQSKTYGGGGIEYHTTIRLELTKKGDIYAKAADKADRVPPMGQIVEIKVPKNKVNDPWRREEFGLIYGRGAENAWTMFSDFVSRGVIRSGAWSKFTDPSILGPNDKSWQGGWMGLSNMFAGDGLEPAAAAALWARSRAIYMEGRVR